MADGIETEAAKPRKRQAVKPATEQTIKKVKSTIHLTREADIRLDIHCTMMGLDRSAMMERLIHEHLKRYVVSDRGKPTSDDDGAGQG